MRHHEKYQTICDYTLTISHDMSVIHDVKLHETPMQKLKEITFAQRKPVVFAVFWLHNFKIVVHNSKIKRRLGLSLNRLFVGS